VFVNVPKLDRDPKTVQRLYDFRNFDFRLKPGSSAIDRGVALPNINDGFTGKHRTSGRWNSVNRCQHTAHAADVEQPPR
jgi:hypothetical protein